ncbi:MAG: TraR/DksA C4-type zinc finger protein [Candidatus Omnitrophica bacterium]|nr:TraR/DksA C4-type zinc finger protein [Candidatus Omnitrophota bacterium]
MAKSRRKRKIKSKIKARPKARAKVKPHPAAKTRKMPKSELKKYKELLLRERSQVGGDLMHISKNTLNKSARDASGDLSGYSYHMADQASDDYDRDFSLGRATEEQKLLYAIDEAIKRVEDGSYGNCLVCGRQIAKRRLMALPHSELCIECQEKKESR